MPGQRHEDDERAKRSCCQFAVIERKNTLLRISKQLRVMGGYEYGHTNLVKRSEHVHDVSCVVSIQVGRWFVRNQYGRTIDDCAGDAQALLLPSRKRNGPRFLLAQQAYLIQCGAYSPGRCPGAKAADLQGQQYIIENIAVEQDLLILKHQPEIAPKKWDRAALERADILAVDNNAAGSGTFNRCNKPQQRGLARARMAGNQGHLAGFKGKADIPERFEAVGIALVDLTEANH